MKKEEIVKKLATIRNGTYTNITFVSDILCNKDNKEHRVQKVVSAVVRLGISYSHINVEEIQNKKKVAKEDDVAIDKLPWGEWDPEDPHLISHKENSYLRCTVSRSPKHKRKVRYFLDGVEVKKEEVIPLTRASEWNHREEYVFNPKIENVLTLGKEAK